MFIDSASLLQFFRHFSKFYQRQFEPFMERHGLSMREVQVLLFLANNPSYDTARDITEFRGISKSQVSQAVDLLTAEGLLLRTPDTEDRRIVHLSITEYGIPIATKAQAIQVQCGTELVSGLTQEQLELLYGLLETVMENGARLAEEQHHGK